MSAMSCAEKGCFNGKKWAYLDNMSIMTRVELYPFDLGSPSINSSKRSSQIELEQAVDVVTQQEIVKNVCVSVK